MRVYRSLFVALLSLVCMACGDGITSTKYCSLPARFSFSPVQSISQLNSSCNGMGEWCTIVASGDQYLFTKPSGSQGVANRTAMTGYKNFYMGLSGFIVGLPSIPEMGADRSVVTCYDLACSNCYAESYVAKPLVLHTDGTVTCRRCQRSYNLNDQGLVVSGPQGRNLYRYRIYYNGTSLAINN